MASGCASSKHALTRFRARSVAVGFVVAIGSEANLGAFQFATPAQAQESSVETIASGRGIRELRRLRKVYGGRRRRKRKGLAHVRIPGQPESRAELHSYEAHGVGRVEVKIKRLLD
jgi:hypothetical protein